MLFRSAGGAPSRRAPPVVADFTSTLLSRPVDVSRYGVVYCSGGKNLGPAGVTLALVLWWFYSYFALPKREYNKVHPFTSFIPIFCYLVLRNASPTLRRYHMHLFAWCGKITLETYILQFHIWMKTTGLNGSPKFLMVWLPGWFYTNFLLTSATFLFISYRIFKITVIFSRAETLARLFELGRVLEFELGRAGGLHHRVEDGELQRGQRADHDATRAEAGHAEVDDAELGGDVGHA